MNISSLFSLFFLFRSMEQERNRMSNDKKRETQSTDLGRRREITPQITRRVPGFALPALSRDMSKWLQNYLKPEVLYQTSVS